MEPVTHFLTGACLGRSGFNRRTAYATLAMTLAAEAPDLDVLWGLRGPLAGFQHHRGITHTFLGAPFVALAVTGVVWLWDRSRQQPSTLAPRWGLLWVLSWLAVLSHIFLDWTNNYGVRPLFPFNPRWYALDIAFIVEPVVFGALVIGLVLPSILGLADREMGERKPGFRGRGWAIAALVIVGIDFGVRAVEHHRALHLVGNAQFGKQAAIRAGAEPYPLNPFHWFAVVETQSYYQTGSVNTRAETVDTNDQDEVVFKPPVTAAIATAKRSWLGRVYLDWARFPLVIDHGRASTLASDEGEPEPTDTAVEFRDLRFGYPIFARQTGAAATLNAWVYLKPDGAVDEMVMNGREQK